MSTMRVMQLVAQVQMQLEDGSTVVFSTPPMMPTDNMSTEDAIRDALLGLGLTPQQAQEKMRNNVTPATDEMVNQVVKANRRGPALFRG